MSKFCVLLLAVGCALARPEAAGVYGYGPRCISEPETIVVKVCHLEPVEACTSEPKVVGHHVTFTKECKEVDVNLCAHGFHHGKRSADAEADPGYIVPKCETVKKEVCKLVPVKEPVEKELETCTHTTKEVCEDVEKQVPKVTCEKLKH